MKLIQSTAILSVSILYDQSQSVTLCSTMKEEGEKLKRTVQKMELCDISTSNNRIWLLSLFQMYDKENI